MMSFSEGELAAYQKYAEEMFSLREFDSAYQAALKEGIDFTEYSRATVSHFAELLENIYTWANTNILSSLAASVMKHPFSYTAPKNMLKSGRKRYIEVNDDWKTLVDFMKLVERDEEWSGHPFNTIFDTASPSVPDLNKLIQEEYRKFHLLDNQWKINRNLLTNEQLNDAVKESRNPEYKILQRLKKTEDYPVIGLDRRLPSKALDILNNGRMFYKGREYKKDGAWRGQFLHNEMRKESQRRLVEESDWALVNSNENYTVFEYLTKFAYPQHFVTYRLDEENNTIYWGDQNHLTSRGYEYIWVLLQMAKEDRYGFPDFEALAANILYRKKYSDLLDDIWRGMYKVLNRFFLKANHKAIIVEKMGILTNYTTTPDTEFMRDALKEADSQMLIEYFTDGDDYGDSLEEAMSEINSLSHDELKEHCELFFDNPPPPAHSMYFMWQYPKHWPSAHPLDTSQWYREEPLTGEVKIWRDKFSQESVFGGHTFPYNHHDKGRIKRLAEKRLELEHNDTIENIREQFPGDWWEEEITPLSYLNDFYWTSSSPYTKLPDDKIGSHPIYPAEPYWMGDTWIEKNVEDDNIDYTSYKQNIYLKLKDILSTTIINYQGPLARNLEFLGTK